MTTAQNFANEFCSALNALRPGWTADGEQVVGPDGASVRFVDRHPSSSDGHTDVEFVLDSSTSLWDCVAGFGATASEKARAAAHLWASTTGGAVLELKYSRRGEFADHFHGTEPSGFPNWHAICGAILGFGRGGSAAQLQDWWMRHPLLPGLSRVLGDALLRSHGPHGLKLFFGGDGVAEVRLDGDVHSDASQWLAGLDWPRLDPPGFVRSYIVLVHPERAQ